MAAASADALVGAFPRERRSIARYFDAVHQCLTRLAPFFAEKVLPFGRRASQVVGLAFLVLGVVVAVGVVDLPGIV